MIELVALRTLALDGPSRPGRPAHVSAASGLVRSGGHLYVVADDENHLGVFPAEGTQPGRLVRLRQGRLPLPAAARKRAKPDFESLVRLPAFPGYSGGALLALGSCSKPNRCGGVLVPLGPGGEIAGTRTDVDLAALRAALQSRFGRLNVEGAVVRGEELVLLQRGNKGDRRNALIRLRLDRAIDALARRGRLEIEALAGIEELELGAVGDVPLGLSDGAALPDGRIVFTAIAEDTSDSYQDGACCGAALGVLSRSGKLERIEPIAPAHKVEGIDARVEGRRIQVLVVTDADDSATPASLCSACIDT